MVGTRRGARSRQIRSSLVMGDEKKKRTISSYIRTAHLFFGAACHSRRLAEDERQSVSRIGGGGCALIG